MAWNFEDPPSKNTEGFDIMTSVESVTFPN